MFCFLSVSFKIEGQVSMICANTDKASKGKEIRTENSRPHLPLSTLRTNPYPWMSSLDLSSSSIRALRFITLSFGDEGTKMLLRNLQSSVVSGSSSGNCGSFLANACSNCEMTPIKRYYSQVNVILLPVGSALLRSLIVCRPRTFFSTNQKLNKILASWDLAGPHAFALVTGYI